MNTKNQHNEYASQYPNFDKTPKAVIAAVAWSLALRVVGDDTDAAKALLRDEWGILHDCGIVPQKPEGGAK